MGCNLAKYAFFLGAMLFAVAACQPCRYEVNGICYDHPNASNPPISARFEAIDADTGKPLPGVMISFYWKTYLGSGKPDQCARNVIGETDANGKFANTGKDGSWMFTEVQMFKAGWERVYFRRLVGQTHISHEYQLQIGDIDMYPAWSSQLKELGYLLDTRTMGPIYRKNFELGDQYEKIMTAEWQPEGLRTYWVKMRGFPQQLIPNQFGFQCLDSATRKIDPNAELVGYSATKFTRDQIELERSKHALLAICDAKWDSVPTNLPREANAYAYTNIVEELLRTADSFVDQAGPRPRDLLAEFFADGANISRPTLRTLRRAERQQFCNTTLKLLEARHE